MRLFELIAVLTLVTLANGASLAKESANLEANLRTSANFDWTDYHSLAEIESWLDDILAAYPDVTEGFVIGKSYEGREIRGIKISYKSGNPGIFIESNIHAREWITSATATWLINELLSSKDTQVRGIAENLDWYIVPVLNVDGFLYTHRRDEFEYTQIGDRYTEMVTKRLWRKTLRPSNTTKCFGVDLNRNYDSHWMANGGASDSPCSDKYAGPHPFSEPETKALSDFVISIKDKLNVFVAFHSYSQLLLSPYGHTKTELPENHNELMQVAKAYADAVKSLPYGTIYEYGSAGSILYAASGTASDWAYNEQDIKISYTIEFRGPSDKRVPPGDPVYGFVLPPRFIIPNAEEALAGLVAMLAESEKLGYLKPKYAN